ncbi:hypothetical protein HY375_02085 [Candidatus Berkelbacteria bacterium]|nr:hypothetical protein [Candidatus Berkelbacteria bacterium]
MSDIRRKQTDKYLGKEMDRLRDQAQKLAEAIQQATLGAQARFGDPEVRPDELTVIVERREDGEDAGSIRILLAIGGVRVRFQVESNGLGLMRTYAGIQRALQSSSITRHIGTRWIEGELINKGQAEQVLLELRGLGSNELDGAVYDLVEAILRGDASVVPGLAASIRCEVAAFGQSKARPVDSARISELESQLASERASAVARFAKLEAQLIAQKAEAEQARVQSEVQATVDEVTAEKQEALGLAGRLEEELGVARALVVEREGERDVLAQELRERQRELGLLTRKFKRQLDELEEENDLLRDPQSIALPAAFIRIREALTERQVWGEQIDTAREGILARLVTACTSATQAVTAADRRSDEEQALRARLEQEAGTLAPSELTAIAAELAALVINQSEQRDGLLETAELELERLEDYHVLFLNNLVLLRQLAELVDQLNQLEAVLLPGGLMTELPSLLPSE